ncbi:Hypothetical_protein [Hexamita inflata]|uniref:Hypothetical_protein n=1 Tax=Hexamita inflata TaxID=28002 RepID=A0AA86PAA5_9EUKA|nr:Hypothetical protein HINF_LOCUS21596 [Hexamita inflata]
MCKNFCKNVCVKITYTLIIGAIFGFGLFYSFDIYRESLMLRKSGFESESRHTVTLCDQIAFVQSPVLHIPITTGYYNQGSQCFSGNEGYPGDEYQYYYFKNNKTIPVYYVTDDDTLTIVKAEVRCVSADWLENDGTLSAVYYITSACSYGFLIVAISVILCIWFFCAGWCKYLCCKEKEQLGVPGSVYV